MHIPESLLSFKVFYITKNMYCKGDIMFIVLFISWFWYFSKKFMQLFHAIIFLKSRAIPLAFHRSNHCLTFKLHFWKFYVFDISNKCFSVPFVAIFCNYSRVLSMHHSDSDADSKPYYQEPACKRDFMFFVLSVLLESRIIPQFLMLMQIIQIHIWLFDV